VVLRGLSLLLVASLSAGCASANLTVTRPLAQPVSRVSLSVEPVGEAARSLDSQRRSQLRSSLTFTLDSKGVTLVPTGEPGVASLNGQVDVYDEGNRVLRYFIGFGAGRGSFASTWVLKDGAGNSLGECRIDGSIVMGGFGGSYYDVVEKVGERLAEFLRAAP
jgi:hypothetical protein